MNDNKENPAGENDPRRQDCSTSLEGRAASLRSVAEYDEKISALGVVPYTTGLLTLLEAAELHYEKARILDEKLDDMHGAWNSYKQAFLLNPKFLPAIQAARKLATRVENWGAVVQIIQTEIEAVESTEEKVELLRLKGLVLETNLGKESEAQAAYDKAEELSQ